MRIAAVYARFFRSFNIDYIRKHHPSPRTFPWEYIDADWQPYVCVTLDPRVTSVVGANEAGKTHLLDALENVITGNHTSRSDFCRYSDYYAITQGNIRYPDFGLELRNFTHDESERLRSILHLGSEDQNSLDVCYIFRENGESIRIWLANDAAATPYVVNSEVEDALKSFLPSVFKIDKDIALPVSIPIVYLNGSGSGQDIVRPVRISLLNALRDEPILLQDGDIDDKTAKAIATKLQSIMGQLKQRRISKAQRLARDLMLKVANIDPITFAELDQAIANGHDGHVNGLTEKINQAIATALNFPAMWAQDKDFQLLVTARDHDLVFTIRDRTGTQYSFEERSSGLRYFLSYYTQYLVHEAPEGRSEVLLMDEPDAYLSNLGQLDLLKVLESYAADTTSNQTRQVVYVTHSPYLINRNHAERVRVLEKGHDDEGTRVVRDASSNHYEPLRSALGAFVAETTFMGHANLMVEGTADQVILVGLSSYLRSRGRSLVDTLDLNLTTIVPAGGAQHIPYLTYLARGRDIDKPAVVVLLDSGSDGDQAKKLLRRDGVRGKQLLEDCYIFQIGDLMQLENPPTLPEGVVLREIADLIPLELAAAALRRYLQEFLGRQECGLTVDKLKECVNEQSGIFGAVDIVMTDLSLSVEKVGFARCIVDELHRTGAENGTDDALIHNFALLLGELRKRLRVADEETRKDRLSKRIAREVGRFTASHKDRARKDEALILIERLEDLLENDKESDIVRTVLAELERTFIGVTNLTEDIEDYPKFRERLEGVRYAPMIAVVEVDGLALPSELPMVPAEVE